VSPSPLSQSAEPNRLPEITVQDVHDVLEIDAGDTRMSADVPSCHSDVELFVDSDPDSSDREFDMYEAKGVLPQSVPAHIDPLVLVQAKKGDRRVREVEVWETYKNGVIATRKVIYRFFEMEKV
jgi:hypothetical protein